MEGYRRKRIPDNWRVGLLWSGLKGAVSIVLVLGLTRTDLPNFETLKALTFGLVLTTNVVQGLTMTSVVNSLKLSSMAGRFEETVIDN